MSAHDETVAQVQVLPPDKKKILKLWKIAGYMALITILEFIIAFTVPFPEYKTLRIVIFVLMTIWKAYYIVSEFMHLGHEVNPLVYSILLPLVFLVWLILALIMEAQSVYEYIDSLWVNILQ